MKGMSDFEDELWDEVHRFAREKGMTIEEAVDYLIDAIHQGKICKGENNHAG